MLYIGPLSGPLNVILTHASPHHLTFSWTPISNSCQVQSYAINSSNCGVCPSYMNNMTTARCIGFQVPAECRFTVRTIVCGNIVGSAGTEVSFTLQGYHNFIKVSSAFIITASHLQYHHLQESSTAHYLI